MTSRCYTIQICCIQICVCYACNFITKMLLTSATVVSVSDNLSRLAKRELSDAHILLYNIPVLVLLYDSSYYNYHTARLASRKRTVPQ